MSGRIQLEDGTFLDQRKYCPFCGEPVEWAYGGGLGSLEAFDKGNPDRMHFPDCYRVDEMRMEARKAEQKD